MKHTLLPIEERLKLKREYRVRAATVALFLLSLVGLIGFGSLFPGYIRAHVEEQAQLRLIAAMKKDRDESGALRREEELRRDALLVKALDESMRRAELSTVVADVLSVKGNIRLTSILVSRAATSSAAVALQGVAPTRDSLLAFRSRLENLAPGSSVDLPVSALARSADIPFALTVTRPLP